MASQSISLDKVNTGYKCYRVYVLNPQLPNPTLFTQGCRIFGGALQWTVPWLSPGLRFELKAYETTELYEATETANFVPYTYAISPPL